MQQRYQGGPWSISLEEQRPAPCCYYYCDGAVCVFPLKPRIRISQEARGLGGAVAEDNLLSESDIDALRAALSGGAAPGGVSSIVVLSPIPVVLADPYSPEGAAAWAGDAAGLGDSARPGGGFEEYSFTEFDIGSVLDVLMAWVAGGEGREAFLVCGGSYGNCSSVIRPEIVDASVEERVCVKQLSCGSLVGVAPDLNGDERGHGSFNRHFEGSFTVMSPSKRRYVVTPIRSSTLPQVGVLTVGQANQQPVANNDQAALLVAGCFHLNLADMSSDKDGLSRETLPSSVIQVWDKVKNYISAPADDYGASVCDTVFRAVKIVFNDLDARGVIAASHELFRQGNFGGLKEANAAGGILLNDDSRVYSMTQAELVLQLSSFLLSSVSHDMRSLFGFIPSRLVCGLIWNFVAENQMKIDNTRKVLSQVNFSFKRDDLMFSSLCGDSVAYSRFCFYSMSVIALFPHCAAELVFV